MQPQKAPVCVLQAARFSPFLFMSREIVLHFTPLTALAFAFAVMLFRVVFPIPRLFSKRIGRRHAKTGAAYLAWLAIGFISMITSFTGTNVGMPPVVYDTVLGALGIALTLTAARDFGHKNVHNRASGTLDEDATVSYDEMIEHAFYQGVNLVQALFLAFVSQPSTSLCARAAAACACTAPWLFRSAFPVHSFSKNYSDSSSQSQHFIIRFLYRIKKWQYVFYKHCLLHGLNVSLVISPATDFSSSASFRVYWLLLNASYVLEFFLQTLVKKGHTPQRQMLKMQKVLMAAATAAAAGVLPQVHPLVAACSLCLNFLWRKHDFACVLALITTVVIWSQRQHLWYSVADFLHGVGRLRAGAS